MPMAYHRFVIFACVLAFAVILLGAYTRLADAGLGCPDRPGCYGHLTVPQSEAEVTNKAYLEQRPLEVAKGWKEMVHRCFAGSLGLVVLAIAVWSWLRRRDDPEQPVWLPAVLRALVIFQAVLGMWTVTLLLLQVAPGIGNVLLHLPLAVATAHNGVAALLLISLIYLNYRLWQRPQ